MKFIYTFFTVLLVTGCNAQTEKNETLVNALTDESIALRGNLFEISTSQFRLDYYDVSEKDTHYKFLQSKGYQGGGPSWLGIIYGAIKMSDPQLLNGIRFDDEAEGIAIWSSDKSKLEKIGRLISIIKSDETILMEAIKVAKKDWRME